MSGRGRPKRQAPAQKIATRKRSRTDHADMEEAPMAGGLQAQMAAMTRAEVQAATAALRASLASTATDVPPTSTGPLLQPTGVAPGPTSEGPSYTAGEQQAGPSCTTRSQSSAASQPTTAMQGTSLPSLGLPTAGVAPGPTPRWEVPAVSANVQIQPGLPPTGVVPGPTPWVAAATTTAPGPVAVPDLLNYSGTMVVALICGGGNGAHVCAGIAAAQPGVEARVISLFADEAERWTNIMKDSEFTLTLHSPDKDPQHLHAKPSLVTKDPAAAMADVNIIIFMVPAFTHKGYLEALKPYVKPGMILAGCPGQAGFEFAVRGIWGDLALQVSVMSFESLPWACRKTEFGKAAEVLGTKGSLAGAVKVSTPAPAEDPVSVLQKCLGPLPKLTTHGHLLGLTLMATNGYLHPSINYGKWHNWDGQAVSEPPLFYNGLDEFSAGVLSSVSDEVVATAKAIMAKRPNVDLSNVSHIVDWYRRCYAEDIVDKTSLYTCIQTNRAYKGLTHPTVKTADDKYVPDFKYRYMTEDIPFGLVVIKGIAAVAGVATPNIDKVITWSQGCMGKEFLVNGSLSGKDLGTSRCPQRYHITDLDVMLGLK